jgi:imidazole glycerol-phosphate synthase subunit HisH
VGAFPVAMERLRAANLDRAIQDAARGGAAVLGICLGHQLLFETSSEFGDTPGLALLPGTVAALEGMRVPHMGWSRIVPRREDPLLAGLDGSSWMYFVHSFAAIPAPGDLAAVAIVDGIPVCAMARRGRVCGVQFHPEKSAGAGARLLRNFLELA